MQALEILRDITGQVMKNPIGISIGFLVVTPILYVVAVSIWEDTLPLLWNQYWPFG